ncbi:MAG: DUF3108 domain-containing protein [Albidovulum sp.]
MTIFSGFLGPVALIAAFAAPTARADQQDSASFDLVLRGIRAGTLSVSGVQTGTEYSATGVLKSGGLVALVRKVRYDARVKGTYKNGRFTPKRYDEDADTGSRQSQSVMEYKSGVPQVKVISPPKPARPGDVAPHTQGGTVDPLTALYAALRDVPKDEACKLAVYMFDGRRRSQVVLKSPKPLSDGGVSCSGEYRRLEGFSEKEMAEKQRFPFVMTLALTDGDMMQVTEISMDTLYGKGRLKRR